MKSYEILYLDCSETKNRIKLIKEIKKVTKQERRPEKSYLEKFSASVGRKYKMQVQLVKQIKSKLFVSVQYEDSHITFDCLSYYEALCKHILIVNAMRKYKSLKVK